MPLPPVAFIIFNRPDLTAQVFKAIREAKPGKLLIIADGPRNEAETAKCREARRIAQAVDWECEVLTEFSEVNLGCKRRLASGLDWVFSRCDEAIILEDDCLPSLSFFAFCRDMLERYRHDERVMLVGGTNLHPGGADSASYYFSRYGSIWGWASCKRAWKHYDVDMKAWPEFKARQMLRAVFPQPEELRFWTESFEKMYANPIDTWDYQWFFTRVSRGGLSISPSVNLVSNLGFRADATHTHGFNASVANLRINEMGEISHPPFVLPDVGIDEYLFRNIYLPPAGLKALSNKVRGKLGRLFGATSGPGRS